MRERGKSVLAVLLQGPKPLTRVVFSLLTLPGPQLTCIHQTAPAHIVSLQGKGPIPVTSNTSLKIPPNFQCFPYQIRLSAYPKPWGSSTWKELEDLGVGSIKLRMTGQVGGWKSQLFLKKKLRGFPVSNQFTFNHSAISGLAERAQAQTIQQLSYSGIPFNGYFRDWSFQDQSGEWKGCHTNRCRMLVRGRRESQCKEKLKFT